MKIDTRAIIAASVCGAFAVLHVTAADATTLTGTLSLSYEETGTTPAGGPGTVTNVPTVPATFNFGNSFAGPLQAIPNIPNTTTPYTFYDDFLISVPTNTGDVLSSSIDLGTLGVNDLQVRLYSLATNPNPPVLGAPNPTAIEGWSQAITLAPGLTGSMSVITPTTLSMGTYVLEVRGVTLSSGGSYSGVMNLNPVPLPAALPLLLSGLGLAAGFLRRRAAA